jgi:ABC-type proline/glycine betaine transport system permease subunit
MHNIFMLKFKIEMHFWKLFFIQKLINWLFKTIQNFLDCLSEYKKPAVKCRNSFVRFSIWLAFVTVLIILISKWICQEKLKIKTCHLMASCYQIAYYQTLWCYQINIRLRTFCYLMSYVIRLSETIFLISRYWYHDVN